jgi:hypothetical protein
MHTRSAVGLRTKDEANEQFTFNLKNAINATKGDAVGVGTIIDND